MRIKFTGEMEMAQPGRNSDVEKVRREDKRWRKSEERRCRCAKRSRNTVFFQCFVAPESLKGGLLKRRVRRHLGR